MAEFETSIGISSVKKRATPANSNNLGSCRRPAYLINSLMLAVLVVLSGVMSVSAQQSDAVLLELMKILRDRGSITEEEYQMLKSAADGGTVNVPPSTNKPLATATPKTTEPVDSPKENESAAPMRIDKFSDQTSAPLVPLSKEAKWYEKIGFGGYTQVRYSGVIDQEGAELNVPADGSVSDNQTFFLRRGRLKFSGDVSPHLYLYSQMDFASTPSSGSSLAVQMRDLYGDIAIDKDKEFRFRIGQSKVPFGWVNMQSSQNRAPMERPDGINSGVEGERDLGVFFMWAPADVRARLKTLVKSGLKGSGDYGMFSVGAYSGQGPNRRDKNDVPHVVTRFTYPFQLKNDQFMELGLQAYYGDFVVSTSDLPTGTPSQNNRGVKDQRVGISFNYYPQPIGIEGEWNIGQGPRLSDNFSTIESDFLHGGYVLLNYQVESRAGRWFPFVRWQYYKGGRKFATNAPYETVNELDIGFEWSPWKVLEMSVAYTHTFDRTNTKIYPYLDTTSADRLGIQAQFNY